MKRFVPDFDRIVANVEKMTYQPKADTSDDDFDFFIDDEFVDEDE
jgi:hypothetical protein